MTERPAPPTPVVVALLRAFPRAAPANDDAPYDERLNGHPVSAPWRDVHPLPVLDPDVAIDLRRAALGVVRSP